MILAGERAAIVLYTERVCSAVNSVRYQLLFSDWLVQSRVPLQPFWLVRPSFNYCFYTNHPWPSLSRHVYTSIIVIAPVDASVSRGLHDFDTWYDCQPLVTHNIQTPYCEFYCFLYLHVLQHPALLVPILWARASIGCTTTNRARPLVTLRSILLPHWSDLLSLSLS